MNAPPTSPPGGTIACVNSLFQQPWWLDALAPGSWDAAEVRHGDEIVARLPYVRKSRLGLRLLSSPPLTQTLGPWLRPSEGKSAKALSVQKALMTELIAALPPHDYFAQGFHSSVTNHLPFHWQGFDQTTRYTYVLDDLTDTDALRAGLQSNIRRYVRKAEGQVTVHSEPDIDAFIDVAELTYERQGERFPHGREVVRRLDAACAARDARRMFFAVDAQGRTHAAAYIVWDETCAYYIMGGGDPALRASGAGSLVLWRAIEFAAGVTRRFDFEGSMIEPIENFFRAFGARQVPYHRVTRAGPRMRALFAGRDLLRSVSGR